MQRQKSHLPTRADYYINVHVALIDLLSRGSLNVNVSMKQVGLLLKSGRN